MNKLPAFLFPLLIIVIAVIAYFPSLSNGFVLNWDDRENVVENIFIRSFSLRNLQTIFTTSFLEMYTPMTFLSYMVDYLFFGLNPFGYHLSNLLLHCLNTVLVFYFFLELVKHKSVAFIVALLFAVHPLNTEAVAWISARSTLLYSFFFLFSCFFYLRYLRSDLNLKYLFICFLFFVLSVLSKPAAVILPLIFFLLDWFEKRKFTFKVLLEKIPALIISMIIGLATFQIRSEAQELAMISGHYSFVERILFVVMSVLFYLRNLLFPFALNAFHYYPEVFPVWYYSLPLIFASVVFLFLKLKISKEKKIFGALFFFLNLILVLKIIPVGIQPVADRYAYLPFLGLYFILAEILVLLFPNFLSAGRQGKVQISIAVLLVLLFTTQTFLRCGAWKNSLTLYSDAVEKDPTEARNHFFLAVEKDNISDYSGAMNEYSEAIRLKPKYVKAFNNRGVDKGITKDLEGAVNDFSEAIKLKPDFTDAYFNRAGAYLYLRKTNEACEDFSKAAELGNEKAKEIVRRNCR